MFYSQLQKQKFLLKGIYFSFIYFFSFIFFAQPPQILFKESPQQKLKYNLKNYIRQFSDEAVKQMIEFKIPASVILAQAIFESGSGTSELALKSNNHFGIKCHMEWGGDTIVKTDDTDNECFRKYEFIEESYRDHSLFLATRERYAFLFQLPVTDYTSWCNGLKNAGYATYPTYAEELIKLIEDEKLYELDRPLKLKFVESVFNFPKLEESELKHFTNKNSFTLNDFCKAEFLWTDERDVVLQSLDMITGGDETEESVAGNP